MYDVAWSVNVSQYTVDNASVLGCYAPSTGIQGQILRRTTVPSPSESSSP
jgi:hypothetical protein